MCCMGAAWDQSLGSTSRRVRFSTARFMNSYSFPDVVHRLSKGIQVWPAAQTVNNVVAARRIKMIFQSPAWVGNVTLGSALVRTYEFARSTSPWRPFDQSRNPNADTHTQVPTPHVSHYTNCAPRSLNHGTNEYKI